MRTWTRTIGGHDASGRPLILFPAGIALIFFDGRSMAGLAPLLLGVLIIAAGILTDLTIRLPPTSLFSRPMTPGLTAAGIGLALRTARHG